MAEISFGQIHLGVPLSATSPVPRRDPGEEFVLAILGDFSGRLSRDPLEPLAARRVWRIDCDNAEKVMAGLGAHVCLQRTETAAGILDLRFNVLEDFHPDQLLKNVAGLNEILTARHGLMHPSTSAEAAQRLQLLLSPQVKASSAGAGTGAAQPESDENTLGRLLGGTGKLAEAPAAQSQSASAVDRLIRNIVAPSLVPGTSPQQAALLSAADLELTAQLRALLHDPHFQTVEAAWRSLDMLVRQFGGEENIKLSVVDVTKEELAADLLNRELLEDSGLCRLLQAQADARPWSAWVGLYSFDAELRDLELLGRIAKLAAWAGAPFLAGAKPRLVGCDSLGSHSDPSDWTETPAPDLEAAWKAIRALPESAYAALALPRFLLRQPYGKGSDSIQAFPFEEMGADNPHEHYLWANPALLCGWTLAEAFREEGWSMRPSGFSEIGDLPLHRFKQDDETAVKPCAEAWLNQRAADAISAKGLVPVMSVKGRNSVRVGPLRSLGREITPLAGPWNS